MPPFTEESETQGIPQLNFATPRAEKLSRPLISSKSQSASETEDQDSARKTAETRNWTKRSALCELAVQTDFDVEVNLKFLEDLPSMGIQTDPIIVGNPVSRGMQATKLQLTKGSQVNE